MHVTDSTTQPRIRIDVLVDDADRRAEFYDATFWSLRATPRELPASWLYDERGSLLFDEITRLPEYYPTNAEREILAARAAEIAELTKGRTLVELGAGTSEKTLLLLDALSAAGTLERFVPLDVSDDILRLSAEAIADRYPTISVHGIVGDFERDLSATPPGESRVIAFLGSTIGNLYPERRAALLRAIAAALAPGDSFLLGIDLVKDPAVIERAYNDSAGVTEQFVRNGLTAANRDLGADFVQERFVFDAFWDPEREWMDIGFNAVEAHTVHIAELEVELDLTEGERLRLEISTKFRRDGIEAELANAGLGVTGWWTDEASRFALVLATG
ncbi:MAG: L-histidine Nalpha-methyltransferase [Gaiellaceae bacterium]|nr:L-histidine Nalpha-methyltransferase [Gaiellaceae bacterium]